LDGDLVTLLAVSLVGIVVGFFVGIFVGIMVGNLVGNLNTLLALKLVVNNLRDSC
jgi:ABC-type nitrate/sulfonate/bicarbonate transport system permease component